MEMTFYNAKLPQLIARLLYMSESYLLQVNVEVKIILLVE